ncbi:hypothetical protein [Mycobacterium sp. 236(2023)]|uniref:hypothetical protein n=1 Tax=Mycobacterium sp. 236(2023) TaxID=3038163 RepID=UPI00241509BB|nr:hypothetical protein [Mycobacterium sp. 236(2023)]MDG4669363.1 hypothetical protein [Mycobacterium sp. 236(2023)]
MTNFGGPNPIGGGHQPPQPPHGAPPPPNQPPPGWQPPPNQPPPGWQPPPPTPAAPYPGPPPAVPYPGHPPTTDRQDFSYPPPNYALPPQLPPQRPPGRRRLILTLAGAAIAVILVVTGIVIVTSSSESGPATAGDTVQAYLEALARGDAQAALSYGLIAPPDNTFLTDEVLKKQIEKAPITDIQIVESSDTGKVHVIANFGDYAVDEDLYLKRDGDGPWKLETAALPLNFRNENAPAGVGLIDAVTIYGENIPKSGRPYVFPGPIEYGSSNPNYTVTIDNPVYLLNHIPWGANLNYRFDITDAGKEAVKKAMMPVVVECAKSTELSVPDCPQRARIPGMVEGTATWEPPTTLDDVEFVSFIHNWDGMQSVSGSITFPGIIHRDNPPRDEPTNRPFSFAGNADMAKQPPVFTFYMPLR